MIRRLVFCLITVFSLSPFLFSCAVVGKSATSGRALIDAPMKYAVAKLSASVQSVKDPLKLPVSAKPDSAWKAAGMYDWRSGFFPGCLWYAYEYSRDEAMKDAAKRWTEGLEPVKDYTRNHDVGFMMFSSYGNGYRLTGNPAYKDVLLRSARSLSTRFNPTVGSILSWNPNSRWKFPVIVDNMMNLELLFWAAKNGGGDDLRKIAETHALTTMKNHVRSDGSTFHVIDYDPATGAVRARNTAQGYADGSAWSRGQAWGLYGFTMTYRETKNPVFLETARKIADYFIAHLPADSVPY
jgi:chondroitin AC lyase